MSLDPDACYRALATRDARFDGKFFVGVATTGVYCRPVCPAQTPKSRNCRFYRCAAEAELAGFRPCLRCRPDTAPGTPAWLGTSATASRALRLIAEGALDKRSVESLAERLGVSARHLGRLFHAHLGVPPHAIANTRRVHFARTLIDQTCLPMTQVAFSAGFHSVRRFNAAVQAVYGRSPTQLRQLRRQNGVDDNGACLRLPVPFRPPFAWESIAEYLRIRATPGVENADSNSYRRTILSRNTRGVIEVRPDMERSRLVVRVPLAFAADVSDIVARVRAMFDVDADVTEIERHLGTDPRLARLLRHRSGLRVPGAWDRFELAVRAVLGQAISVRAATTMAGRLARVFGEPLPAVDESGLRRLFPTAAILAEADLSTIGITHGRAEAIRQLAIQIKEGTLDLEAPAPVEVMLDKLMKIPGIGEWTAQYIALRACREPDAWPAADLGLRRALANAGPLPSPRRVEQRSQRWRPWRAYAAMHLWINEGRVAARTRKRSTGSRRERS